MVSNSAIAPQNAQTIANGTRIRGQIPFILLLLLGGLLWQLHAHPAWQATLLSLAIYAWYRLLVPHMQNIEAAAKRAAHNRQMAMAYPILKVGAFCDWTVYPLIHILGSLGFISVPMEEALQVCVCARVCCFLWAAQRHGRRKPARCLCMGPTATQHDTNPRPRIQRRGVLLRFVPSACKGLPCAVQVLADLFSKLCNDALVQNGLLHVTSMHSMEQLKELARCNMLHAALRCACCIATCCTVLFQAPSCAHFRLRPSPPPPDSRRLIHLVRRAARSRRWQRRSAGRGGMAGRRRRDDPRRFGRERTHGREFAHGTLRVAAPIEASTTRSHPTEPCWRWPLPRQPPRAAHPCPPRRTECASR
jgi:hypothetical protein